MEQQFDWMAMQGWTAEEVEYYLMGPFDGGIPGLVRRIRRILDVSQRGLAAILEVSQSVVARWETGRTSPRAVVLQHLLRLAGVRTRFVRTQTREETVDTAVDADRVVDMQLDKAVDREVGMATVDVEVEVEVELEPMRDDGARDRGGRRFPAHVDLTVTGWWRPRGIESTADVLVWRQRSRARRDPAIRYHTSLKRIYRILNGTPVDHPSLDQLTAEAVHLDEVRQQRRQQILADRPGFRPPPGWLAA